MQALLQEYDILDCVTVINLCASPPTVEAKLASVLLSESRASEYLDGKFVEKNRQNGSLTVLVWARGTSGLGGVGVGARLCTVMTVPSSHAPLGSWIAEQEAMGKSLNDDVFKYLRESPDGLARQLEELTLATSSSD